VAHLILYYILGWIALWGLTVWLKSWRRSRRDAHQPYQADSYAQPPRPPQPGPGPDGGNDTEK
jgi:hypothetical protein